VSLKIDGVSWRADYRVGISNGRPAIEAIHITPTARDVTGLSTSGLRELIAPSDALREVREGLPALGTPRLLMHGITEVHGRRPKRKPDYFYAVIAAIYTERCQRGSTSPTPEIGERLRAECPEYKFSPRSLKDQIEAARERGLLGPSPGGTRPGGNLTDLGRDILEEGPPEGYRGPELPR
jgi:hypothetical protein